MAIGESYVSFDEYTLFDGFKNIPPPLFTEDSIELRNDDGIAFDENHENDSSVGHSKRNKPRISDSARQTCEIVLDGFEKSITNCILVYGKVLFDLYEKTENADTLMGQLTKHHDLLENQSTTAAYLLVQLKELLTAIQEENYDKITVLYYRSQHKHTLNDHDKPVDIPVLINDEDLNPDWIVHIKNAMQSINEVTPGVNLHETKKKEELKIEIGVHAYYTKNQACTVGSINGGKSFIHLGYNWNTDQMKGTSLHELMHALGFNHEMQRHDSELYLKFEDNVSSDIKSCLKAITRFDPFSVMMYSESQTMKRKNGDKIWLQKPSTERAQELSELNKVALNLKFKPCRRRRDKLYLPDLNQTMKMIYCGRKVMRNHSQSGKNTTDGYCGKNNWANCAACRVLLFIEEEGEKREAQTLKNCLAKGKWQGLSGLFYCGKDLSSLFKSRRCGPDNGEPCTDCEQELYNRDKNSYYDYLKCQIL